MVAPVRCATPGTDVVCARYPPCCARSTIQSASTPPPSPPSASTAMVMGRTLGTAASIFSSSSGGEAAVDPVLQPADHRAAQAVLQVVPARRIGDDRGAVERRAEHGGVRDLAAQPAADAGID